MADETTPQLPSQAQTGLPGAAQAASDITTAPPAADVLGPAAYGDKGWQQYQDLQRAGQQAPVPPTPTPTPAALPGDPNASGLGYLLGAGGAAAPSPLMDLFGGQGSAMKFQNAAIQQQEQATALQQKRQALAANGFAFLDSLRKQNVPLSLRAPMIQQWAAQQGLPIDPIQASYIAQWGNDPQKYEDHLLEQLRGGGPAATEAAQKWSELFSGDYNRMIAASDAVRKDKAATDLIVAKAEAENRKATGALAPPKTAYQGERAAATESLTKELGRTPNESEITSRIAQIAAESKAPPASSQKTLSQIDAALGPINKLESLIADPKYKNAVDHMGPQMTYTNPLTGATRSLPFTQDTEGSSHDNIAHPMNTMWWNYKQGGQNMAPEDKELMAVLGTVSASGWQGLTSGIRNRAVIEDVKQHIPRPWDEPGLVKEKINWIKQWYGDIKTGIAKSGKTFEDMLNNESGPNPMSGAGKPTVAPTAKPAPTGRISAADFLSQ